MGRGPSMLRWWRCCQCAEDINSGWYWEECTNCNHVKCDYCSGEATSPHTLNNEAASYPQASSSIIQQQGKTVGSAAERTADDVSKTRPTTSHAYHEPRHETVVASRQTTKSNNKQQLSPSHHEKVQISNTLSAVPHSRLSAEIIVSRRGETRDAGQCLIELETSSEDMLTRQWLIPFSSPVAWTKRQILRKSIPPRMKRVQWTCACGVSLYDDYEELMSGAAANFETCLQAASSHNRQRQNVGSDDQTDMAAPRHKDLRGVLTNILGLSSQKLRRTTQGELPSFELRSEIPEQTTTSNEPSPKALFLLVCMNDSIGDSVIKLQQLSVHDIESDRKLFKVLGQMYATNRYRWWSFLSLWSLKRINFVNFDVYAKFLVDIKDLHVVPPDNEHSYLYQRSGLKPPIGSNLLMHYMRCPQDATILTPCLEKVPKKVDGKLQVCPVKGVTPGWGLHFIEGWHWKRIFLGSFFAFLASAITVAITCRHLGRSVQDAMAISSFMLACFALSVGALQAWLNMV